MLCERRRREDILWETARIERAGDPSREFYLVIRSSLLRAAARSPRIEACGGSAINRCRINQL